MYSADFRRENLILDFRILILEFEVSKIRNQNLKINKSQI